jgi:hypothetical protein
MEPSQYASFLSSNDIIKSDSDTVNVSRSTLARFPSLLLSRKRGTALVVRSSDVDPTEPSVQMSWTGEETHSSRAPAVALPPSYVTHSYLMSNLQYCTDMTRRAYPRLPWSIPLLKKLRTHAAYDFFRHRHLQTPVLRSICLSHQIRGCRGSGKRRYRAILADNSR